MRYSEIISEGRDAPVYHATGLSTAVRIIQSNQLRGSDAPISLTRNKHFAKFWIRDTSGVVFVLDQSKLASTYPIIPGALSNRPRRHEAEEMVPLKRPIKPLDRYLVAIEIAPDDLAKIKHIPAYAPLLNHPLLRIVKPFTAKVNWMS